MDQERIRLEKKAFLAGEPLSGLHVREEILASWKRSQAFGVVQGKADKSVLPFDALQHRIRARHKFCDISFPVVESLYGFTKGTSFLLTLSDEEGYVLKAIGDEDIVRLSDENGLVEGCNRSEHRLGTNGIGTPLESKSPIQVFGSEHYYELHHNWVCSGAPIFYPDGRLAGSFCLTGTADKVSLHTLGMAVSTADAITRQLKMKEAYDNLDLIQKDLNIIIETVPSAILLLDGTLHVRGFNAQATKLLNVSPGELTHAGFLELLGKGTLDEAELRSGMANRYINVERDGLTSRLSISVQATGQEEYVVQLEKTDTLHKRVNRIIGSDAHFSFQDIIGKSPALSSTVQMARVAAGNNSNVLLTGESGTGKELFAQAIHNASSRRNGPFVAINCGALPKSLIESELFGYEGGSFTGANRNGGIGKFELANGGTIFLDEIGDMPFDVQVTLLRVLQNREISRVGSGKTIKIDVRIISATNQDLQSAIERNSFRSDLYYRLNVFSIHIPPLRERGNDMLLLADYFCKKYAGERPGTNIEGFSPESRDIITQYGWPGNVRELENVVERAVYLTHTPFVQPESLSLDMSYRHPVSQYHHGRPKSAYPSPASEEESFSIRKNERRQLENALLACNGNVKKAAALLEISRRTMYRKLEKYEIEYNTFRNEL